MATEYRPCVVAVFTNPSNALLVCERSDVKGAWQFPQGGIEPGQIECFLGRRGLAADVGVQFLRSVSVTMFIFGWILLRHFAPVIEPKTMASNLSNDREFPDLSVGTD